MTRETAAGVDLGPADATSPGIVLPHAGAARTAPGVPEDGRGAGNPHGAAGQQLRVLVRDGEPLAT